MYVMVDTRALIRGLKAYSNIWSPCQTNIRTKTNMRHSQTMLQKSHIFVHLGELPVGVETVDNNGSGFVTCVAYFF